MTARLAWALRVRGRRRTVEEIEVGRCARRSLYRATTVLASSEFEPWVVMRDSTAGAWQ